MHVAAHIPITLAAALIALSGCQGDPNPPYTLPAPYIVVNTPDTSTPPTDTADGTPSDASPEDASVDDTSPEDTSPDDTLTPDTDLIDTSSPDTDPPDAPPDTPPAPSCDDPPTAVFEDDGLTEAVMTWVPIQDAEGRDAVCNDGSPAGYYLRRGTGDGLGRWLILLAGGTICATPDMCDDLWQRVPSLMSSTFNGPTRGGGGMFDADPARNPDFYNANHVWIPYCSSDYWSGDQSASETTGGWHFRGTRILMATLEDLINPELTPPPNLYHADEALLIGNSAGGVGLLSHLDRMAEALPCVQVRGFNDAGWGVNFETFRPNQIPIDLAATYAQGVWNGQVDRECGDSQGLDGMCFFADVSSQHVTTPFFTYIGQQDGIQLGALGVSSPFDDAELEFVTRYRERLRESLMSLDGAFSPASGPHTVSGSGHFQSLSGEGNTIQEVFGNWYFDRDGPKRFIEGAR